MRAPAVLLSFLAALVVAVPALADDPTPHVRACSTSQFGDLGRDWRQRAVVAGHVALVGMKGGYRRVAFDPVAPGMAMPLKVLVVVDPSAAPTISIAPRSRAHAALGYNGIRHGSEGVPLSAGTPTVRFRACRVERSRAPWNRGTQFGGYFLVAAPSCVHVDIAIAGTIVRRKLSFGARCR